MSSRAASAESRAWLALGLAILVISSAAILARLAQSDGIGSFAMAGWRLSIAALLMAPWALRSRASPRLTPRSNTGRFAWMLVAGALLGVHFVAWFESLKRIPVALSAVMLATSPIWVALIGWAAGLGRPRRMAWMGFGVVLAGFLWLLAGRALGLSLPPATAGGIGLAMLSAASFAGYLTIGQQVADRVSLKDYLTGVTGVAGGLCLGMALSMAEPILPASAVGWACLAGLALGPHLIGHGVLNWSIRRLPLFSVAVATLGEPLGAALLASIFLGERIPKSEWGAYGLLMVGVLMAAWGGRRA